MNLYTIEQARRYIKVSRNMLVIWTNQGKIKSLGKTRDNVFIYTEAELDRIKEILAVRGTLSKTSNGPYARMIKT